MYGGLRVPLKLSSPAKAGDPVRRGFSVLSLTSLEYWVARSRLRQGYDEAEFSARRSFSEGGKPGDDTGYVFTIHPPPIQGVIVITTPSTGSNCFLFRADRIEVAHGPVLRKIAREYRNSGYLSRTPVNMTTNIPIFDGHNDVLLRLYRSKSSDVVSDFLLGEDVGHIDLKKARAGAFVGGLFAMYSPSPGNFRR